MANNNFKKFISKRLAKFIIATKFILVLFVLGLAGAIGLILYYSKDLPDYSQLAHYKPPAVTRIYAQDGQLIKELFTEYRVFVPISAMPRSLLDAFIAAEDKNFYDHPGVDLVSTVRAAITNVLSVVQNKRLKGGSTITQQVVKKLASHF